MKTEENTRKGGAENLRLQEATEGVCVEVVRRLLTPQEKKG